MTAFTAYSPEYTRLLRAMKISPARRTAIIATARKLIRLKPHYLAVSKQTGVPIGFMATSFEREASSNFNLSPAQGDPWRSRSTHVPRGRGPFRSWDEAARDAYHIDGLDKVGAKSWTWDRFCFESETFNGFGYRRHGVHSPYLWSGTNAYGSGKFVRDGVFSAGERDVQLGVVPVLYEMIQIDPDFALVDALAPVAGAPVPAAGAEHHDVGGAVDVGQLQRLLNALHVEAGPPLIVDGLFGRKTRQAVKDWQASKGLPQDGVPGPALLAAVSHDYDVAPGTHAPVGAT